MPSDPDTPKIDASAAEPSLLPAYLLRRQNEPARVAVIGAGPAGLEAALYARRLGCKVWLFEREDAVAADVRAWAHVTMFTPWSANRSPLGELALREAAAAARRRPPNLAAGGLYPAGGEFVAEYLEPLAHLLDDSLLCGTRLVAVGRSYLFPNEHAEAPLRRRARRFRLLTRSPLEERIFTVDYVLDATGLSHSPNWLGVGGLPALGEMGSVRSIFYGIPDVLEQDRRRFLGQRTLLVGDGPSAATSALLLAEVIDLDPPGSLLWVTKSRGELPYTYQADDPLPRRDLLYKKANLLVKKGHPRLEYLPVTQVEAVHHDLALGQFHVTLQVNHETRRVQVDALVANVGFRTSGDTFERHLQPGEPDFFTIGAKGTVACLDGFLIQTAHTQIRDIFRIIMGDPNLDLYADARATAGSS